MQMPNLRLKFCTLGGTVSLHSEVYKLHHVLCVVNKGNAVKGNVSLIYPIRVEITYQLLRLNA